MRNVCDAQLFCRLLVRSAAGGSAKFCAAAFAAPKPGKVRAASTLRSAANGNRERGPTGELGHRVGAASRRLDSLANPCFPHDRDCRSPRFGIEEGSDEFRSPKPTIISLMWNNLHAPHEVSSIRTSSVDASRIAAERTKPPGLTQSPRPDAAELAARLIAAFKSRSCTAPQDSQRHSRIASVRERFRAPQPEHNCELGNHLSAFSNATPYNSHLYSSIRTNSDIAESDTERARRRFLVMPLTLSVSHTMRPLRLAIAVVACASDVANPLVQFTLLEKIIALRTFPAPRLAPLQSRQSSKRTLQRLRIRVHDAVRTDSERLDADIHADGRAVAHRRRIVAGFHGHRSEPSARLARHRNARHIASEPQLLAPASRSLADGSPRRAPSPFRGRCPPGTSRDGLSSCVSETCSCACALRRLASSLAKRQWRVLMIAFFAAF